MREEWIDVNVGRSEDEEDRVVHGDVDEIVQMNTEDAFKGDLV